MKSFKNIRIEYSICLSVVLFFFVALFPFQTYAQQEELFDNTWYLYKFEIDEEEYFYPDWEILSGDESSFTLQKIDELTGGFDFMGCPGWGCSSLFEFVENENKIILEGFGCLAMSPCDFYHYGNHPDFISFEYYFNNFYLNKLDIILSYDLQIVDNVLHLIFTDSNGDKAYYSSEYLSTPDFDTTTFTISPNPVQDQLSIRLDELSSSTTLEVYDIHGRLLDNLKINEIEIQLDVSDYASGMYFIKMKGESGITHTSKFIKE